MDLRLLSVPFLSSSYIRKADQENVVIACTALLKFAFFKGLLLETPLDSNGELKRDYEVYESGLTEKGTIAFEKLKGKWLSYTDRTQKYDNISMLEKWYSKMTS